MGATLEVTTLLLQNHIRNTLDKLTPLLAMANAPMVKYFTEQLWKTHIPEEIQREIQTKDDIRDALEIYWQHLDIDSNENPANDKFKNFRAFLANAKNFHLDNLDDVWVSPEKLKQIFDGERNSSLSIKGFMSMKKNHEVNIIADVIASMCASTRDERALGVIDAGDGKGYLSTRLSLEHDIKVLGVDYNPGNTLGAILRSEKLERYWGGMKTRAEMTVSSDTIPEKQSRRKRKERRTEAIQKGIESTIPVVNENYRNATHFITPQTDFIRLFSENFGIKTEEVPGLCLSGLHTCGNLAPSCLRIFNENKQIVGVCNIGCCYHLLTEQFSKFVYRAIRRERSPESKRREVCEQTEVADSNEQTYGFPMSQYLIDQKVKLGRNARMLACQTVHRVVNSKELPSDHLFYRALLEALIQRKCPEYVDRIEVGRIKQCHNFVEYVRKSAKRNPVLHFDDLTDEFLDAFHDEFREGERFLDLYHLLRVSIAAIVENVILLDRFLYLKEQAKPGDISYLVRFFDPVVSPRCYGVIAMKNFQ